MTGAHGLYEPFAAGNEVSLVHGARSERHIGPLAAQYTEELLASPATPDYLQDPSYAGAVQAYCWTLAICVLLREWLSRQDIDAAMTDQTTLDEDEERRYTKDPGEDTERGGSRRRTTRRSVSRHVSSVLDQIHKHETRAITLRRELGLTPLSRARLGRDLTAAKFDLAKAIAELSEREARGERDD